MRERPADLPDFAAPPVHEVALSLQFDSPILKTPYLGLFWNRLRQRYSEVQAKPPLESVVESFGPNPPAFISQTDVVRLGEFPTPRCWFMAAEQNQLIQLQGNRIIHNWRKTGGDEHYPRYESIRETFLGEARDFVAFAEEEGLGALSLTQCEVTYINQIQADHGAAADIFSFWSSLPSDGFLPPFEKTQFSGCFLIPGDAGQKPRGRLHCATQLMLRKSDNSQVILFELTARGRPLEPSIEGAFGFFDLGREWIVRGFAELTTPKMHAQWKRLDDHNQY